MTGKQGDQGLGAQVLLQHEHLEHLEPLTPPTTPMAQDPDLLLLTREGSQDAQDVCAGPLPEPLTAPTIRKPFILASGRNRSQTAHAISTTWSSPADGQAETLCGIRPYAAPTVAEIGLLFIAAAPDTPRCPNCYPPTR